MNLNRLKELEIDFLSVYPLGLHTEELEKEGKKHNVGKLSNYVRNICSKENLENGITNSDDLAKIILKSTMVSVFEKVKFRDIAKEFIDDEKSLFVYSIHELLHGNEEEGFNGLIYLLKPYKLAKWSIITAFKTYYDLNYEVFMKPTTVKKIINYLELDDIKYQSLPTYDIYFKFRNYINLMKKNVDISLAPNNPAFTAFLMLAIQ